MTATPTSAEVHEQSGGTAHSGLVIAMAAVGGVVAVVLWLSLTYAYDVRRTLPHSGTLVRTTTHLAPWPYWSQFLLIPFVALVGARFAPGRVRAIVIAACAGQVLFVLVMKGAFLLDHEAFAIWLWISELVLVGLAYGAARLGRRLARSGIDDSGPPSAAGP